MRLFSVKSPLGPCVHFLLSRCTSLSGDIALCPMGFGLVLRARISIIADTGVSYMSIGGTKRGTV